MEAEQRMADLVNVTSRLIDVLERENELLRERRHSELSDLLEEKETIGRIYQARITGLRDNPDQLQSVAQVERDELKDLAFRVDELVAENALMLKAAITVSTRIVDMVADAVRENANAAGTYSNKGSTGLSTRKSAAQGGALALDQTL